MIEGLFNGGSLPVLERVVQFTGQRQALIANNIANISTPHFRPRDLSVEKFQKQLRRAVEDRRSTGTRQSELRLTDSREFRFHESRLEARPETLDENILFHDRNNRDLERIMQDLTENRLAHTAAIQMLKSEFDLLKMAIRERLS